jgi:hypothetical protein
MPIVQHKATENCNHCGLPGPLSQSIAQQILDQGMIVLENDFLDGNVDCEAVIDCFYSSVEHPRIVRYCQNGCSTHGCTYIQSQEDCYSWLIPDNPHTDCFAHEYVSSPCQMNYNTEWEGSSCYDQGWSAPQYCYGYGTRQYANFVYTMTCTDLKYQSPIDISGFQNLKMILQGHVAQEHEVGPPNPC